MANTIQIKRAADNGTSSVPSGLASGEMALDQAGRKLYIGRHNNSSVQVAHLPMLDDLTAGNGITLSAASGENDRGRTVTLRQDQSAVWATDSAKGLARTFVKTPNGLKVVNPEGYVAIDKSGGAVKIVDKLEFSFNNFTVAKNWDK